MKLNDIPEGDTHAYSCAHPHAYESPHTHTICCFENDSLWFIHDKVLSFMNMNLHYKRWKHRRANTLVDTGPILVMFETETLHTTFPPFSHFCYILLSPHLA